jgi:DNA-binding CsgD family transcriptional regulator
VKKGLEENHMVTISPKLDQILEALEQAATLEGLQTASEALRDHYGVNHIVYHWVDSAGDQYGCGTYSVAWQERYLAQNYLRIDPVVSGCYQRFHLLLEAIEYGVGNQGFSVPIRGPNGQFALFTVNHSCSDAEWEGFAEANRRDLILIAHYFNEKALEIEPARTPEIAQALSPREIDAMTLIAIGFSRAQVAQTLSISEHTLRVYIESARFKLGALNTTHAVARALSRGLIVV